MSAWISLSPRDPKIPPPKENCYCPSSCSSITQARIAVTAAWFVSLTLQPLWNLLLKTLSGSQETLEQNPNSLYNLQKPYALAYTDLSSLISPPVLPASLTLFQLYQFLPYQTSLCIGCSLLSQENSTHHLLFTWKSLISLPQGTIPNSSTVGAERPLLWAWGISPSLITLNCNGLSLICVPH